MRGLYYLLPILFLLTLFTSPALGNIIHVPGDSATIQAGVNGAVNGDTVLVADGTYTGDGNRDIDFLGKAIVVMSENGPDNCVIDCGGSLYERHRGFIFENGEDANSVVQGFTIMNGMMDHGGGIWCQQSSPTIAGNIIRDNIANGYWGRGGGISCFYYSSHHSREHCLQQYRL